jgi:glutaredoxin-like protein NrdH
METVKVRGNKNTHKVLMYALSTCGWCKMTKAFLRDRDIEHEFIDVDLCSVEDRARIREDIVRRGGTPSFPTLIIDDETLITGFDERRIREALDL